jgi:hypothetical protein
MLRYILIIISLVSGLILYIGFRTTHTPIYQWAIKLGLGKEINFLRNTMQGIHLPDWIVYSMPDGLWMFSFVLSVLSIWNFNLNKTTGPWIFSAIFIGLGFEIMQGYVKGIGVFDWNDLLLMIAGTVIALSFCSNKIVNEKRRGLNQLLTKPYLST